MPTVTHEDYRACLSAEPGGMSGNAGI
ncbi:protein of unknown function [Streptomyces sp. KY75]|nr:protein of unknown function [Streptomyces sp. KY75]